MAKPARDWFVLQNFPLVLAGRRVEPGDRVHIGPVGDRLGALVDGNTFARSIQLVTGDAARENWRTGLNWQLVLNRDGTWSIINQGLSRFCLSGAGDGVMLSDAMPEFHRSPSKWLMYRVVDRHCFVLRPLNHAWLTCDGDRVSLSAMTDEGDPRRWWSIKRFDEPAAAVAADPAPQVDEAEDQDLDVVEPIPPGIAALAESAKPRGLMASIFARRT